MEASCDARPLGPMCATCNRPRIHQQFSATKAFFFQEMFRLNKEHLRALDFWPDPIADLIAEYSVFSLQEKVILRTNKPDAFLQTECVSLWWSGGRLLVKRKKFFYCFDTSPASLSDSIACKEWRHDGFSEGKMTYSEVLALNTWLDSFLE